MSTDTTVDPAAVAASDADVFLTRDEILAHDGRRFTTVPVNEWKQGAKVRISSLSSEMRDQLENYLIAQRKAGTQDNVRAMYVYLCAVDANGERLFTDPADVAALGKKSAVPIDRIFTASLILNDLGDEAVASEAGNSASEDSAISSAPSPSNDSTASPVSS